jgi:hypothetical protein
MSTTQFLNFYPLIDNDTIQTHNNNKFNQQNKETKKYEDKYCFDRFYENIKEKKNEICKKEKMMSILFKE